MSEKILSTYDKARIQLEDDYLLSYLKGAVYRFKYLQTLRALAACAEVDVKLRE